MNEDESPTASAPEKEDSSAPPVEEGVGLALDYNSETRELSATLSLEQSVNSYNFNEIKALLDSEGYSDFAIPPKAINDLVAQIQRKRVGTYLLGIKPEYTEINLRMDEADGKVKAILVATDEDPKLNPGNLQERLRERGYADFYFEPGTLDKILGLARKNQRGEYVVGERKDAEVLIETDKDEMTAFITLKPAYGGRAFCQDVLSEALNRDSIDPRCCDKDVLSQLLREKVAEKLEFARGVLPAHGKDAQFEALVEEVVYKDQKACKTGRIDLLEIRDFTLVEEGTELMRRTPPQEGTNGYNVRGLPIPADHGEDIPWNKELSGAEPSPSNENLLLASTKGHPVILTDGVRVDQTLVVNNVSMSIGNIDFDGSVLVKGEVMAGITIKATGDINVNGVVTNASLNARNNIVVGCGVIGAELEDNPGHNYSAVLVAGGDIRAQYVNLAKMSAGNNIEVKEYISHCETEAENQILVGQGGGKGRIFGGECFAGDTVIANAAGIDGGIKTFITVGPKRMLQEQYEDVKKKQEARLMQAQKLSAVLNKLMKEIKNDPANVIKIKKAKEVQALQQNVAEGLEKLGRIIISIEEKFKQKRDVHVTIKKSTLPNVVINVNGAQFLVRQEGKGGKFVRFGNDIRWEGLK